MRVKRHAAINTRQSRSMQRAALQAEKDQAIQDGNLERAKELIEELKAIAPKSNGRSSSSVFRDPYDPELLEIYAHKPAHEILGEYGKEIRLDFGFLGVVPGLANIVVGSAAAVGEPLSEALCRELVRRVFVKMHERNHGMGMLYCERANQVLRKLYEHPTVIKTLGLPTNERPWVKRKPLGDVDADFGRRWMEYCAGQVDSERQEPEEGETTSGEKTTEQVDAEPAATSSEQPPSHSDADGPQESIEAVATNSAESEVELQAETEDAFDAEPTAATAADVQTEAVTTDSATAAPELKPGTIVPEETDDSEPDAAPFKSPPSFKLNDLLE